MEGEPAKAPLASEFWVRAPANATAGRVTIHMRKEGNPDQHDLVSRCWFKFIESDTGKFILGIFKYSEFPGDNYHNNT